MPGYIKKQLQKHEHIQRGPFQHSPYPAPTMKNEKDAQDSIPEDNT